MERLSNLVVAKVKITLSSPVLLCVRLITYHASSQTCSAWMLNFLAVHSQHVRTTTEMQPRPSRVNSLQEEK